MNIYLLTLKEYSRVSYIDKYISSVVIANNEEEARKIYPGGEREYKWWDKNYKNCTINDNTEQMIKMDIMRWGELENIIVTKLGEADNRFDKSCVINSDFRIIG